MIANFASVNSSTDVDELVFLFAQVREAARCFAELAERFRHATSRSRTPSILKHDVNTVFAQQAGELLCKCWRRGMFFVYRPKFYLPLEEEPRLRCVFAWFTFVRSHLAPAFKNRFRADWQSEFAPEMDQIKGQKDRPPPDFGPAVSDDPNELALWRLELFADVHATACVILSEELEQLREAIERRVHQLPDLADEIDPPQPPDPPKSTADAEVPKFNPEFVALELLAAYFPVDGSTVNRWAKKLLESQREKRPGGHHGRWYVDYHAFRLLPNVMQWDKLPMDKAQLKKPNRSV